MKRFERWLRQPGVAFRAQLALAAWGAGLWLVDGYARAWPFDELAWLGIAGPILLTALAVGARSGGDTIAEASIFVLYLLVFAAISIPAGELGSSVRGTGERLDLVGSARALVGLALAGLAFFPTHAQLHVRVTGLGPPPDINSPTARPVVDG
jgi:hypothetical protein